MNEETIFETIDVFLSECEADGLNASEILNLYREEYFPKGVENNE